ncbi:MAG: glycerophosphodiester phosphodiesterase family protein [Calditrichota bacterium]
MMYILRTFLMIIVAALLVVGCGTQEAGSGQQAEGNNEQATGSGQQIGESSENPNYLTFESSDELRAYFRWAPGRKPMVSAHRGGPQPGYPENSIEAMQKTVTYGKSIIEIDVTRTKDSKLVLMHDKTIDRTTTGSGDVKDFTLAELKKLSLKDEEGTVTSFKVPTLEEALNWARGKAVLSLDSKGVSVSDMVDIIRQYDAESFTIPIAYTVDAAERFYNANQRLLISCPAQNYNTINMLFRRGLKPENIIGFVGTREPKTRVYKLLHKNGICAILGTLGNLDRSARARGKQVYVRVLQNGADVLATDNVPLVTEVIKELKVQGPGS